jgi:NitT/TauT family transport system permease protein
VATRSLTSRPQTTSSATALATVLFAGGWLVLAALIGSRWSQTNAWPGSLVVVIWLAALVALVGLGWLSSLIANARGTVARAVRLLPAILVLVLAVTLTEALLRAYKVPAALVPFPSQVFETLWTARIVLWRDLFRTFVLEVLTGYVIGSALGIGLALLVARFKFLDKGLMPYASLFSSIPIVAIAPVALKAFGLEWPSKMIIVVISIIFPVLLNTARGLQEVSPMSLDLMRSYGSRPGQVFGFLRIPNALPYVFNALKLGTTLAMIGAIVAEFSGADGSGLGFRILVESGISNYNIVWAAIIVSSALGIASYNAVAWLEKRYTGWHVSNRE